MDRDIHGYPTAPRRWQRIVNESWPQGAATIKDQPHPIDVTARVVWEYDGEETVEGRAIRWTRTRVLVAFDDPRWQTVGVWLLPSDVKRR